jgi:D-amino-acid dehydrogenase
MRMATYDLIIVGGGIVGASAALAAVRTGASVALVDAHLPGRASDAGAGIISPVALDRREDRPEWTSVVTRCVAHYRELLADIDALDSTNAGSATFRQVGELVVARDDPSERATLTAIKDRLSTEAGRSAHGVSETPAALDGPDLRTFWPELREDLHGLFIADVGRVAGDRLTARLIRAARRFSCDQAGTPRLTCVPGWGTLDLRGTTPCIQVGNERLSGGAVILASGAWAAPELEAFGLAVQIRPVRGQIVHLRLGDVPTGERPVVNTTAAGYLLGFDDRIVVGATHEDVGFDARVTAGGQRQVLDGALELAPGLGTATLVETRVGLRPVSSDGLPMIGAVVPGVHLALGLGAWGLTLGPLFGQLAAADALGDRLPEWAGFLSPTRTAKQPDDDRS